jgi:26S proteasome regulatory subunit N8
MEALEPEEIGIEHILRDLKDVSTTSLTYKVNIAIILKIIITLKVQQKYHSLEGMVSKIVQIKDYLSKVYDGTLAANNEILSNI